MMTLEEARKIFQKGEFSPVANLYEAAFAYGQANSFDPIITGDWNQVRLLLQAIAVNAPDFHEIVGESLSVWMAESKMYSVREVAERTGLLAHTKPFNEQYIRAELARGNLRGYKIAGAWMVSDRQFTQWWNAPRRAMRGNRAIQK